MQKLDVFNENFMQLKKLGLVLKCDLFLWFFVFLKRTKNKTILNNKKNSRITISIQKATKKNDL